MQILFSSCPPSSTSAGLGRSPPLINGEYRPPETWRPVYPERCTVLFIWTSVRRRIKLREVARLSRSQPHQTKAARPPADQTAGAGIDPIESFSRDRWKIGRSIVVNQLIHAPARARGYCPQHAEMSWRTTLTVLTALTAGGSVLDSRAYPDRPCSRGAPLG
jgi:hypothetical protein